MKTLLTLAFLALPFLPKAQDTLIAEIKITKDTIGYNISFTKNLAYPDAFIKALVDEILLDTLPPKQRTPKITKM